LDVKGSEQRRGSFIQKREAAGSMSFKKTSTEERKGPRRGRRDYIQRKKKAKDTSGKKIGAACG